MTEELNLNTREAWSSTQAEAIALQLGYVFNPAFVKAVTEFSPKAEKAVVPNFLKILGTRHLQEYRPPLQTLKK